MTTGYTNQFSKDTRLAQESEIEPFPTPSSTVDLEREAEDRYPIGDSDTLRPLYHEWELIEEQRKAYIKGRQTTSQKGLEGWISCEDRLPTIADCSIRNNKVAALPHHPDASIAFVCYYNVHANHHSHWHPINLQLPNQ